MALFLEKAVVRNVVASTIICLVISSGLAWLAGGMEFRIDKLAWLIVLAFGIGLFSGWQTAAKIKAGVLESISKPISYLRLSRTDPGHADQFDWNSIDDYGAQLASRGFRHLGDFTLYPSSPHFSGVASCFSDAADTTLIEVQHMRLHKPGENGIPESVGGMHFSIVSIVGGNIRVTTTDHVIMASNYMIRGDNSVVASYPGSSLLALLSKHEQLLLTLQERTGKSVSTEMTMERYLLLTREGFQQARRRLSRLSGMEIARQIDAFEAKPATNWAPPADKLAALPFSSLEEIDHSDVAKGLPPIIDEAPSFESDMNAANASDSARPAARNTVADDPQIAALKARMESGASWFYWIAGLSIVNIAASALGSDWGFAIGLGMTQILSAIGSELLASQDSWTLGIALYAASIAVALFFVFCGKRSRLPSVALFALGMALFGLDTIIFLLASDWIGLGFHILALYFLWSGMSAAVAIKKTIGASAK